jgi:hypothetical protein
MFRWIFLAVSLFAGMALLDAGVSKLSHSHFEPPPGPLDGVGAIFYLVFGCIFFFGGLAMLVRNLKKSRMG